MRQICGTVTSEGAVLRGDGFTCARTATGIFQVRLNEPLRATPVVIATAIDAANYVCTVVAPSAAGFKIQMYIGNSGAAANTAFSFVVYE